ncbi:MAG: IS3 family transposase [Polyangiaceae bacterium]|jgi:putative transposase
MVDTANKVSVRRQCELLLRLPRSGLYYAPQPTEPGKVALMRRIHELHLRLPFYGSRKLAIALRKEGHESNGKHIQRLMGLEAMFSQARTSWPSPEHATYPYLFRGLDINRISPVWAADISVPQKAA